MDHLDGRDLRRDHKLKVTIDSTTSNLSRAHTGQLFPGGQKPNTQLMQQLLLLPRMKAKAGETLAQKKNLTV